MSKNSRKTLMPGQPPPGRMDIVLLLPAGEGAGIGHFQMKRDKGLKAEHDYQIYFESETGEGLNRRAEEAKYT